MFYLMTYVCFTDPEKTSVSLSLLTVTKLILVHQNSASLEKITTLHTKLLSSSNAVQENNASCKTVLQAPNGTILCKPVCICKAHHKCTNSETVRFGNYI